MTTSTQPPPDTEHRLDLDAGMNAGHLLTHFDRIADAPDAGPRLRRFILDLAVRGKLVPQDPNDEPASELLKRIVAEKARLIRAGEIRKPRELGVGEALTVPFEVPQSWQWVRLDSVGAIIGGGTPPANEAVNFAEPGQGIPWLTPADLGGHSELFISRGSRDLTEKGLQSSSATLMSGGTVLFTSRAPIGYVAIAANPISTNQGFKSIVPYVSDCSRFIAIVMQSFAPEIDAQAPGTTFREASGKIVTGVPFPLPPLAEQHRIVAKVDALMALCDRLEAARTERETTRNRLAAASLACLNAPDPGPAMFRNDATFALDNLTPLTTRPDQIKDLRQSILNLAVRGKLVPQDSNDEPASELLKRIVAEKARLIRAGEIRKPRELGVGEALTVPFEVPQSWQWVRLDSVGAIIGGGTPPANDAVNFAEPGQGIPWLTPADLGGHSKLFISRGSRDLTEKGLQSSSATLMSGGTVLFTSRAPIGYVAIAASPISTNQGFKSIVPYVSDCSRFIAIVMQSFAPEIDAQAPGTTFREVSGKIVAGVPFPLPPLAEQHRIVAKVDELMALCDHLEANLTVREEKRGRLLESVLHEALDGGVD